MTKAMPVFTILAKDRLALRTLAAYHLLCVEVGLTEQAQEVFKAMSEMSAWQKENYDQIKWPDHKHIHVRD